MQQAAVRGSPGEPSQPQQLLEREPEPKKAGPHGTPVRMLLLRDVAAPAARGVRPSPPSKQLLLELVGHAA